MAGMFPALLLAQAMVCGRFQVLAKPQNLHINDSATEAWHFIAEACISREQAGGNPCTRPWHARHMSTDGSDAVDEGGNSDLLGDRLHVEIGFPVPGDVVVCTTNTDFVCPIDLILYMPVSTRPSGGEVLLVRLGTKVVRSLALSSDPSHAYGCPRLSGVSPANLDFGACQYKLSLRDITTSGDFTIQVDVVGVAFSYRSILHPPKVSFSVVMEGTCGADQDVLVTLLHYGSTHNLTRAIRALHDAAIVRVVRRPSVDPNHLHILARAEEATRALTSLLTAERCRHERQRVFFFNPADINAKFLKPPTQQSWATAAWHGYHVVVEDWVDYPKDYLAVAVANVEFFARALVVGFQGVRFLDVEMGARFVSCGSLDPGDTDLPGSLVGARTGAVRVEAPRAQSGVGIPGSAGPVERGAWACDVLQIGFLAFHSEVQ